MNSEEMAKVLGLTVEQVEAIIEQAKGLPQLRPGRPTTEPSYDSRITHYRVRIFGIFECFVDKRDAQAHDDALRLALKDKEIWYLLEADSHPAPVVEQTTRGEYLDRVRKANTSP